MSFDFDEQIEFRLLGFIQDNYGHEVFTPGLERTRVLYGPYVDLALARNVRVTIVAGSNGKGQTAHTLTHLLETAKLATALWTSPHILSLRERFHINGADVSYEELEREIHLTHEFLRTKHLGLVVSFYEFLFLVFLRLSFDQRSSKPIDHLVLEVGLGGRLDAVNHFDADCACITSISRDHQAILGSRYDKILSEKIAVSRRGKVLFTQFRLEYLNSLTAKYCNDFGVIWKPIPVSHESTINYFEENELMASELFSFLEPGKAAPDIHSLPKFKGRREEMTFKGNTLIFIGAHNIDGIRRMIELFSPQDSKGMPTKLLLSFSKRPSSELEIMLKTLVDFFGEDSKLLLTSFVHPKALELSEIVKLENKFNKISKGLLDFVTDWKTELNSSCNQNQNQKILVCGSYYFVGEVQRFILSHT